VSLVFCYFSSSVLLCSIRYVLVFLVFYYVSNSVLWCSIIMYIHWRVTCLLWFLQRSVAIFNQYVDWLVSRLQVCTGMFNQVCTLACLLSSVFCLTPCCDVLSGTYTGDGLGNTPIMTVTARRNIVVDDDSPSNRGSAGDANAVMETKWPARRRSMSDSDLCRWDSTFFTQNWCHSRVFISV